MYRIQETIKRQEHAKTVASYVDANQKVKSCWQAFLKDTPKQEVDLTDQKSNKELLNLPQKHTLLQALKTE